MMHQYNGQYFPQVPDQYVVPHLNADQKLVWEGLQKVQINAWHNNRIAHPTTAGERQSRATG